MSILSILLLLVIVGFVLYLVRLIPMEPTVQKILTGVVVLVLVLWLLDVMFGIGSGLGHLRLH